VNWAQAASLRQRGESYNYMDYKNIKKYFSKNQIFILREDVKNYIK